MLGALVALACLGVVFVVPLSPTAEAWPEDTVFGDPTLFGETAADGTDAEAAEASPTELRDEFIDALNELRAEHNVAPLRPMASMHHAAHDWTEIMVEDSRLAHADVIYAGLGTDWKFAGENVGRGLTVTSLMDAFMASETHRANILDSRFTHVGVAVVPHDEGRMYTTHRFAQFQNMQRGIRQPVVTALP